MKRVIAALLFAAALLPCFPTPGAGLDLGGYVEGELRVFPHGPAHEGQDTPSLQPSAALAPELTVSLREGRDIIDIAPFLRIDSVDHRRTHADLRELSWSHGGERYDLKVGMSKVFWGVTESRHLVDIVNQADLVEQVDGEEKLGQPMVNLAVPTGYGTFEVFFLPRFRKRTFPGEEGRLRFSWVVETDDPVYESGEEERHKDWAFRWSHSTGVWDVGLSWFHGTSREPRFVPDPDEKVLITHYDVIDQGGLDLQATFGATLWKLEAITRKGHVGQKERFEAFVAGLEHTLYGVAGSRADVGLLAEYLYDNREEGMPVTPFDNDLFVGARLALNDMAGTSLLAGGIVDLDKGSVLFQVEGERRLSSRLTVEFDAVATVKGKEPDILDDFSRDDHLGCRLKWYF